MSSQVELFKDIKKEFIDPFARPGFFYAKRHGFIAWRMGTGMNIELLHIRAWEMRQGSGTVLLDYMLGVLETSEVWTPYHSVYGFTRVSNTRAIEFYTAMGFRCQEVVGLYRDGRAVLFCQQFQELIKARDVRDAKVSKP